MKRFILALFAGLVLTTTIGCPDYSHLREVPDYENMTDSAGELTDDSGEAVEAKQNGSK